MSRGLIGRAAVVVMIAGLAVAGHLAILSWLDPAPARPPENAINVIAPYRADGTWVFDDPAARLRREPFVVGIPEMIDDLVKNIPNAGAGFRLYFSAEPFPDFQRKLTWVRADGTGNWYRQDDPPMEGWLCPALFKYYRTAPRAIYVKAEAKASNRPD